MNETWFETTIHARRAILYDSKGNVKKYSKDQFDMSIRANDGTEICELVGLYIHTYRSPKNRFHQRRIIPRRRTSVIRSTSGSSLVRFLKKLITIFKDNELKITVIAGKNSINFVDINFCLNSESYQPYRKPKDEPLYINRNSNNQPTILSRLPQTVSKKIPSL